VPMVVVTLPSAARAASMALNFPVYLIRRRAAADSVCGRVLHRYRSSGHTSLMAASGLSCVG
jgi:hypothetical protein